MDQLPDRQALEDNSQKKDKWWKNKSLKEQEMVSDSFKIPVLKKYSNIWQHKSRETAMVDVEE